MGENGWIEVHLELGLDMYTAGHLDAVMDNNVWQQSYPCQHGQ